jgi:hypothetical protein
MNRTSTVFYCPSQIPNIQLKVKYSGKQISSDALLYRVEVIILLLSPSSGRFWVLQVWKLDWLPVSSLCNR